VEEADGGGMKKPYDSTIKNGGAGEDAAVAAPMLLLVLLLVLLSVLLLLVLTSLRAGTYTAVFETTRSGLYYVEVMVSGDMVQVRTSADLGAVLVHTQLSTMMPCVTRPQYSAPQPDLLASIACRTRRST